jgi:hypothetical protein
MEDDAEYRFHNIEDIIIFVQWLQENFSDPGDYAEWFEVSIDDIIPPEVFCTRSVKQEELLHSCPQCKAKFSTTAGLDIHISVLHKGFVRKSDKVDSEFWDIITNSFDELNNEDQDANDEDSIPDTD